jgi:hypothetical protein
VGVPGFWHASSVHGLWSSQSTFDWQAHTFGPPTHCPPEQVSEPVQALPSLHGAELLTWTQAAVGVPGFWHASSVHGLWSSQSAFDWQAHTFGPPTHTPPEQVSGPVQAFPSLHGVPS